MFEFMTIRELYELCLSGDQVEQDSLEYVELEGWVRTNRPSGKIGFIALNDGTYFRNAQVVYSDNLKNFDEAKHISTGSAIHVLGKLKYTPEAKQPFEIEATEIEVEGACDEDYPLQKKRHSFEYLREIPHLRVRGNTFFAIFRLRSVLSMAIHEFFQSQGFVYVHTPIITGNDGEGAGEMFRATTIDDTDFEKDFFGKEAFLTVTGQLHVEAFAMAFRDVYTFGPAFRAENSNTTRHAAEFWHVEPEVCFAEIDDIIEIIEDFIKHIIKDVMTNCPAEMEFLNQWFVPGLIDKLNNVLSNDFARVDYTDAVEILKNCGKEFKYPVEWGSDLQTEHEKYLTEEHFKKPLFVVNYPAAIKSFYMKQNPDGKTVAATDLLVPGLGEIIGCSEREADIEKLKNAMISRNMPLEMYQEYLDTRKFGSVPHSGFGLGFDRMLMYVTGVSNIRDTLMFPRTVGSL